MRFSKNRVGSSVPQSITIFAPVSETSTNWHSLLTKEPSTMIQAETEFRLRRTSRLSVLAIPQMLTARFDKRFKLERALIGDQAAKKGECRSLCSCLGLKRIRYKKGASEAPPRSPLRLGGFT